MKRRIIVTVAAFSAVALAIGVAWALWSANNTIHTSLQISARPGANLTFAATNDDEAIAFPLWDPLDSGRDPSGPSPLATRYGNDIGNCAASLGPAANEASLNITAAYGGYWCDSLWGIQNPAGGSPWTLTAVRVNTVVSLQNCPTLTPTDLNADTQPDIEACAAKLDGSFLMAPIIGGIIGPGEGRNALVSVHVMDSATGGATRLFDITFVGSTQ